MSGPTFANDTTSAILFAGSVTGATGVAPLVGGLGMRGLAPSTGAVGQSIVRLGAGSYEIHLTGDNAYQTGANCEIRYTALGVAATDITVHTVSWAAGVITVQTNAAAVATDANFTFVIERIVSN